MNRKIVLLAIIHLTVFFNLHVNAQNVSIIPLGSSWKYFDKGTNQGVAWRATSFNDSAWAVGNGQLGYGDGDENTVVSYGPNSSSKYLTTYFRKKFSLANPASFSSFALNLLRDDGAVIYLNGTEIARSNMPTGTISYTSLARTTVSGTAESALYSFSISASSFVAGNNLLAVEVHQVSASNADISFDLKLDATPAVSCGTPGSLNASSVTTSSALLSWSSVTGASGYNIQYRAVGSASWTSVTSTTTSKSISGLLPATSFEYRVQAICSVTGSYSLTGNFVTLPVSISSDTLVSTNSTWRYLDNGTDQGTAWRNPAFVDAAWASGNAELGYGDGGEATVVSYGPNSSAKYITTYFRKSFSVTDPSLYPSLTLGVVRDDGIVVYLNGTEVYRNNMPAGAILYNTLSPVAISGTDESAWYTASFPGTSLVTGNNVLAVEIHQQSGTSTDISFNARLFKGGTIQTPVVTRGAYLQKLTPNSIAIRWRTDIQCNSKVQFGTTMSYSNSVTDAPSTTEHNVTISGLTPATNYFYSIGTTSVMLQGDTKNNFYTAPLPGTASPVRIWVIGDFGSGSSAQTAVRDAYVNYTGTTPTNAWLWLGDNAYTTGTDAEFQSKVFAKYPDQMKSFPLFPSPGNHDYGTAAYQSASALTTNFPYFSIFSVPQAGEAGGVPSGTPKYYSFNYANIHFISLDSYGALNNSTSPMYTWLNSDLAANTQRWTIVYFHHPPYTKGSHDSDDDAELINMRTNIVPLIESYHVDVVLCGHSHVNERSYLIKGHVGNSNTFTPAMKISTATNAFVKTAPFNGTVYAVCGTSGEGLSALQPDAPLPCMYYTNNTNYCSLVMDVNGDNLSCKYLASTGSIVDEFTISKTGARVMAPSHENVISDFSVITSGKKSTLNYFLETDVDMKIELMNVIGETIVSFDEIPSRQSIGFHQIELLYETRSICSGLYFIRLSAGGNTLIKKVWISN